MTFILISFLISFAQDFDSPLNPKAQRAPLPNCYVHIEQKLKTNELAEETFPFRVKNKNECKKIADSFRPNFAPQSVVRKTVEYQWAY